MNEKEYVKKNKKVKMIQILKSQCDRDYVKSYPDKIMEDDYLDSTIGIGLGIPDIIFYQYEAGSYEGNGDALYYRKGKWNYASLGHCSCYGACESMFETETIYKEPKEIFRNGSTEIYDFVNVCLWIGYELGIFKDKPESLVKPYIGEYEEYVQEVNWEEYN